MKIAFISNYFNHHQQELSFFLNKELSNEFRFIETKKMREDRKKLGYKEITNCEYVLDLSSEKLYAKNILKILSAFDILIVGSCDEKYVNYKLKKMKLIFRYTERPLKNGNEVFKYIPRFIRWHILNLSKKNSYVLCASAYTAADYSKFFLFKDKTLKWGYFPSFKRYSEIEDLIKNKQTNEIMWCGRLIDWKHPDDVLEIARRLKKEGLNFKIKIIGNGPLEEKMKLMIEENNLHEYIYMLGSMSTERVRKEMEKSAIYLLTSDFKEGWGAVLNEAMNSGCAVIASHAAGSVPFLIKNGVNGFVYESGQKDELYEKTKQLLLDLNLQKRLGRKAYETIANEWNAEIAAKRLIEVSKLLLNHKEVTTLYESGPCSRAEIIDNDWYKYEK